MATIPKGLNLSLAPAALEISFPKETAAALGTRLRFILQSLKPLQPKNVLDIGCGTGEHLTSHLSTFLPNTQIWGVDSDERTIAHATGRFSYISNLTFSTKIPDDIQFNAIIASEVLEHVHNPYVFLLDLKQRLRDDGRIILTLPNGYGCSEMMSFLEVSLSLIGVLPLIAFVKKKTQLAHREQQLSFHDTMANSPHINFFDFGRISHLFEECGLDVHYYQGRMFLHNFLFTFILDRSEKLSRLNARWGGELPAFMVSDWMFSLEKNTSKTLFPLRIYKRNIYERMKMHLNYLRFGLPKKNF